MSERQKRYGHAALLLMTALLVGGVLLLWSWNTLAPGLFDAPRIRFKEALAFEFLLCVIFGLQAVTTRLVGRSTKSARGT